ncbi:potassium/proton antiporter [bacterium]|nr:potassium/proton antiporter [bacterium]
MFLIDSLVLIAGVLLLLAIMSSKLSTRLGVPVLVLFLLLGMLAGSEGIAGIEFENYPLAHGIGTVALAMILFDGGLGTSIPAIRLAWKPAVLLSTLGVLITALVTGVGASLILGISWLEGLLMGSIVASTDAAAVFSVMRSGGMRLPKRLEAVLEIESASNDAMAIFLTIGCIEVLLGNVVPGPALLGIFFSQMIVGAAVGLAGGFAGAWLVNRIDLNSAGLYPVLVSAIGLLTFGVTTHFAGSGFLAIYLAGVVIGNRPLVFQRGILLFHDAIAWLSQIVMFVVLGLLCFPSRLLNVAWLSLAVSAVLIFVARPLAVFVSTRGFRFTLKETVFMSWVGLKGAVPITLATFPLMLATPEKPLQAPLLFDVVFFTVVVSAVIQGTSLTPAARWLGLEQPPEPEPPVTLEINSLKHVHGEVVDYAVGEDSRAAGRLVRNLTLPEGATIAMIARGDQIVPPQGNTRILAGDHVILVLKPGIVALVSQVFGRDDDSRGTIPDTLEFPLRARTTISELQEFYLISVEAPPERTLAEVICTDLGCTEPKEGDSVKLGPLRLRIARLGIDGKIEMVGMSILPEQDRP